MRYAQREALKLALQEPVDTGPVFDALAPDTFSHPTYRAVFEAIGSAGGVSAAAAQGIATWGATVLEAADNAAVRRLITELGVEPIAADAEYLRVYSQAMLARLQEVWIGDQIAQLKAMLARMRPSAEEATYRKLFTDLLAMEEYRRELQAEAVKVDLS